jgi:NitT/TauT family transport system ATP-binding protein
MSRSRAIRQVVGATSFSLELVPESADESDVLEAVVVKGEARPDSMGQAAAISLQNLSHEFLTASGHSVPAIEGISLDIRHGEFLSIVGPSGCGKSTLLTLISGLTRPTSGTVLVNRVQPRTVPRDLGFVFQRDALLPWKTALQNVELPLAFRDVPRNEARSTAEEWLGRVGLARFVNHYPHQLSGGMRKRVSLAATMVYRPRIILMDEPFSALDVQTREIMEADLMSIWHEFEPSVVFVTHDLEEAISMSDRVVTLTAGPGRLKSIYEINLGRPRNMQEIRFSDEFAALHREIWDDLRDEVRMSHATEYGTE